MTPQQAEAKAWEILFAPIIVEKNPSGKWPPAAIFDISSCIQFGSCIPRSVHAAEQLQRKGEGMKWLYSSCSATYYRVLSVGKDANGNDCLSMQVDDINVFLDDDSEPGSAPNLGYAEPRSVVFHDVPWSKVPDHQDLVELRTPGGGCYRCTKLFWVKEDRA